MFSRSLQSREVSAKCSRYPGLSGLVVSIAALGAALAVDLPTRRAVELPTESGPVVVVSPPKQVLPSAPPATIRDCELWVSGTDGTSRAAAHVASGTRFEPLEELPKRVKVRLPNGSEGWLNRVCLP